MLDIIKQISAYNHYNTNNPKYIVLHYVGAVSSAKNNAIYFCGGNRNASSHYFVDDISIYQVVEDNNGAWHVGNTKTEVNNKNSIGIEMCLQDNYEVSEITEKNTLELVKYLMSKYNIPIENVRTHAEVTNYTKICPNWNANNWERWNSFKSKLAPQVAPTKPQIPTPQPSKNSVTYQVHISNRWLPNVTDLSDYAGIFGNSIDCVYANADCDIRTRVHVKGGNWLPWVSQREDYAGIYGKVIDGIQVDSSKRVKYRVYTTRWLPWVYNLEDYAGIYGQDITGLQIVFE